MRKAPLTFLIVLCLAGVLATPAVAALTTGVSQPDTLDSRPPVIQVTYPAGSEIFHYTATETLRFTIDEQSWGGDPGPIGFQVISGGTVLDQGTLEPEPTGDYAYPWSPPGFAAAGPAQPANLIIAATDRFGWSAADTSAQFSILDDVTDVPGAILRDELGAAAPNPFNPSTTIGFSLAAAADVELAVYDLRGLRIATLVNSPRAAGHHQVLWLGRGGDGRTVASGVYFARLSIRGSGRDLSFVTRLALVK